MLVGAVYMFAGSVAPQGYLLCDGSAVSRSTYADLFNILDTTYGEGDGETTFNLPNLSGKVIVGSSESYPLGTTGGEETHVLTSGEIPSHNHEVPQHGHSNDIAAKTPVLTHSVTQPAFTYASTGGTKGSRVIGTGGYAIAGTSTAAATRSANVVMANHAAATCSTTGSVTDCAAFDTATSGGGIAHNNMQPFIAINYIIYTGVL